MACVSPSSPDWRNNKPFPNSNRNHLLRSQEALAFLQSCPNFNRLKQIHAKLVRSGLFRDHTLATNLLRLCSSYKKMDYALNVFDQMRSPPTFSWNIMIRGFALCGDSGQALCFFHLMISQGVPPDKFTYPFVIKVCTALSAIDKGREVHAMVIKSGFSGDMFVQNTLIDFYFKCGILGGGRKVFEKMRARNVVSWTTVLTGLIACGELDAARGVFEKMPLRNVVSWTAMINGYARSGQPQGAFELFCRMQLEGVRPNEFTLVSLLVACTDLGSLNLGSWIHDYALSSGFAIGPFLGTALIDMYSNCGSLEEAREVFNRMKVKSLASWNSMITSLGVHGCGEEALALFAQLERADLKPDAITFVGVLCACAQIGTVEEGVKYFKYMQERYGITPLPEHYSCLIELSKHANALDDVSESLEGMPKNPNDLVWPALFQERKAPQVSIAGRYIYIDKLAGGLKWPEDSSRYSSKFSLHCFKVDAR